MFESMSMGKVTFWALVVALPRCTRSGELCVSPVGLSMVTKLAPTAKMTGHRDGCVVPVDLDAATSSPASDQRARRRPSTRRRPRSPNGVPMSSYYPAYEFLLITYMAVIAGGPADLVLAQVR